MVAGNGPDVLLTAGQTVQVKATVMNGPGETWYEVTLDDGTTVYTPKSALTLQSYFASQINLEGCTVQDGMTLQQKAYRLDVKITSVYPVRSMVGYLDGKQYASWSGTGSVRELPEAGQQTLWGTFCQGIAAVTGKNNTAVFVIFSSLNFKNTVFYADSTLKVKKRSWLRLSWLL